MSYYGDEQVAAVKAKADLAQLMGEYTALKESGGQFVGCCVFHQERTPSMRVYPDEGRFHCFGCGAHGDAIDLVREKERLDFPEALEWLAKRVGVILVAKDGGKAAPSKESRQALLDAVEFGAAFYERQLRAPAGTEAMIYLRSRGFTDATIARFRLGWAPGHGALVTEARAGTADLVGSLVTTNLATEKGDRCTDFFFDRLMFPICDRFGQPIAFSGRLLPAAEIAFKEAGKGVGKYVNNRETPLYHKGSVVWNLHRAKRAARERGRLLVMEGPTDVMAADQAGVAECVAVMGCRLSTEHCKHLGNAVGDGRLFLVLDGDDAGQEGGEAAARTALACGCPIFVATMPDGDDPAELFAEHAPAPAAVFDQVLAAAVTEFTYLLRRLAGSLPLNHRDRLAQADVLLAALQPLPDRRLRDLYLGDLVEWLGLKRKVLVDSLAALDAKAEKSPPAIGTKNAERAPAGQEATTVAGLMVRDGGFHSDLIRMLHGYLAERGIVPDAVGGWLRAASDKRVSVKHRQLVNAFHFRFAPYFESLPRERIDMMLSALVEDQRQARRTAILAAVTGRPSTDAGRAELRKWIRGMTGREDPTDVAVIIHFLWQVKRLNTERATEWDLMAIFRGDQGTGKSSEVRRLCSPLKELFLTISARHLTDERSFEALSDYAIGFWDEMTGSSKADVNALKHAVSAVSVNYRELGGHNHNILARRMVFIAATNEYVQDLITDTSGARRYYEIHTPKVCDFALLDTVDHLLCWQSVSEDDPAPILPHLEAVRGRQAELVHHDVFDAWLENEDHRGWPELVLAGEGLAYQAGPGGEPPVMRIPAYDATPRGTDGEPCGYTLHQVAQRFGHYCREARIASRTHDWISKRLRQAKWALVRPWSNGKGRTRFYRRPADPILPATGPSRGEKMAAAPSAAEDVLTTPPKDPETAEFDRQERRAIQGEDDAIPFT